jgi:hypothetical protein
MEWLYVREDVSSDQADQEVSEYQNKGIRAIKEGGAGRYSVKIIVDKDGQPIIGNRKS